MAKFCFVCGHQTIFFKWSSTREFPIDEMLKKVGLKMGWKKQRLGTGRVGVPVCHWCCKELEEDD